MGPCGVSQNHWPASPQDPSIKGEMRSEQISSPSPFFQFLTYCGVRLHCLPLGDHSMDSEAGKAAAALEVADLVLLSWASS